MPGVTLPLLPEGLAATAPIEDHDSTLPTSKRSADLDGEGNKRKESGNVIGSNEEGIINPRFDAISAATGASSQKKILGIYHRKKSINFPENAATISIGAAWILAHLVFGQKATRSCFHRKCFRKGTLEETLRVRRRTYSPGVGGRISVWGGEARVLSPLLLSCPDVGWCPPHREDVMAAAGGGAGGSMSVFLASVGSVIGERDEWIRREGGRLRRAACRELVEAGLCSWVSEEEEEEGGEKSRGDGKGVVGVEAGLLELRKEVRKAVDQWFVFHSNMYTLITL